MYKTVRQGENSLQYTILPQTEEVLSNSGMKGKGRDYSPSIHVRRTKKGADGKGILFAICFLLAMLVAMVGTVCMLNYYTMSKPTVVGAAERAASFVASVVGVSSHRDDGAKLRKKELRMSESPSTLRADPETTTSPETTTATAPPPVVTTAANSYRKTKPAWLMPAFKILWKSSSPAPTAAPPVPIVEDQDELNMPNGPFSRLRVLNNDALADVIIRPTVSTEPSSGAPTRQVHRYTRVEGRELTTPQPSKSTAEPSRATSPEYVLITTKWSIVMGQPMPKENLEDRDEHDDHDEREEPHGQTEDHDRHDKPNKLEDPEKHEDHEAEKSYPLGKDLKGVRESILDDEEEFKELEVDEVFSLPPLKKEGTGKGAVGWMETGDGVTVTKASSPKLRNMWPFEPSMSIFQWPDYTQEDSMVVPLLVGTATLLTVALVLTAVVVRRRRDQAKGASHIGKLTADLQADDNTNLLTAESQEEE